MVSSCIPKNQINYSWTVHNFNIFLVPFLPSLVLMMGSGGGSRAALAELLLWKHLMLSASYTRIALIILCSTFEASRNRKFGVKSQ